MILYEGPSQIDGAPIVAIATFRSRNQKTGAMVQVWILRADMHPAEASQAGADASVCGDCPQRHALGGGCYVRLDKAPAAVWRKYSAGGYGGDPTEAQGALLAGVPIRLGAYGDPAAVPGWVWEQLLAQGVGKWTGYTHQWRHCDSILRELVMASCDTPEETAAAQAAGWRTFSVVPVGAKPGPGAGVECLSDSRGITCLECTMCDGRRGREHAAASVWIEAHGSRKARYALPVVR